jgi:hypothetical protein
VQVRGAPRDLGARGALSLPAPFICLGLDRLGRHRCSHRLRLQARSLLYGAASSRRTTLSRRLDTRQSRSPKPLGGPLSHRLRRARSFTTSAGQCSHPPHSWHHRGLPHPSQLAIAFALCVMWWESFDETYGLVVRGFGDMRARPGIAPGDATTCSARPRSVSCARPRFGVARALMPSNVTGSNAPPSEGRGTSRSAR